MLYLFIILSVPLDLPLHHPLYVPLYLPLHHPLYLPFLLPAAVTKDRFVEMERERNALKTRLLTADVELEMKEKRILKLNKESRTEVRILSRFGTVVPTYESFLVFRRQPLVLLGTH